MANTFTLDNMRKAAEAKYGSTLIEYGPSEDDVCELINPLRLSKEKRTALMGVTKRGEGEDAEAVDQEESFAEIVRLVAKSRVSAEALIEAVGGDLATLAEIFSTYMESGQSGEASASQN